MTHLTTTEAAIVAAGRASEATAELLRFAREGDHRPNRPFAFETEPVLKLAEALKLTIDIEGTDAPHLDDDERTTLIELQATLGRFLEGWVG